MRRCWTTMERFYHSVIPHTSSKYAEENYVFFTYNFFGQAEEKPLALTSPGMAAALKTTTPGLSRKVWLATPGYWIYEGFPTKCHGSWRWNGFFLICKKISRFSDHLSSWNAFESKNCLQRASKNLSSSVRVDASKMSRGLRFVGHFLHSEEENLFGIHDLNDKRVSVLEVTKGEGKIRNKKL